MTHFRKINKCYYVRMFYDYLLLNYYSFINIFNLTFIFQEKIIILIHIINIIFLIVSVSQPLY